MKDRPATGDWEGSPDPKARRQDGEVDEAGAPAAPGGPLGFDPVAVLAGMNLPVLVLDRESPRPGEGDAEGQRTRARFRFRWANAEWARMSGRDAAWARGRKACEVCPGGDFPFREVLTEVLATGESARFEHWCAEHRWTCQGNVFRAGPDQVALVLVDVSRQMELLAREKRLEREVRARLDALPVMVYELDADGSAIYWNRETARVLDLPLARDESRPLDQVLDPRSLEIGRAAIAQVLERDEPLPDLIYDAWSRSGRRVTIQATGRRLEHEGRPPTVLVVARDITKEQAEREAQEALVRRWEPSARSRLRHDLNNILGRIMAAASLVEMEETLSSTGAEHLEMVLQACEEAAEIIARDRADEKGQ